MYRSFYTGKVLDKLLSNSTELICFNIALSYMLKQGKCKAKAV
uniref:Uncharacterized protein n=1 Tax=Anguilla anguilla TaxID=7936 RepID=A0A0E9TMI8_ANGAN